MFWRRSHKEERRSSASGQVDDGADDLTRLQRQFGIKPVKDADVQAEYEKLFSCDGQGMLLGADDSDEDEEARILRSLQLDGSMPTGTLRLSQIGVGADEDDHGVQQLVASITRTSATTSTTTSSAVRQAPAASPADLQQRVRAMKQQALALKREGRTPEALALLREAKQLEAQPVPAPTAVTNTIPMAEDNVPDVTDEDMNDPEYLAQLAAMGLAVDPPARKTESLDEQIRQLKIQALEFKRQNLIPDALACMRKIKQLEIELAQSQPITQAVPHATTAVQVTTTRTAAVADENHSEAAAAVHTKTTPTGYALHQQPSLEDEDMDPDVTEDDMNDPAFAAELSKLGFGDGSPAPPASQPPAAAAYTSIPLATEQVSPAISETLQSSSVDIPYRPAPQSLQRQQSSFDDEHLIDEFEDDDAMAEDPPHLVRSYAVLATQAPPPPLSETAESESVAEDQTASLAELRNQLQKTKESALRLKREGHIKEALEAMRRMKQIENLVHLKEQKMTQPTSSSPESKPVSLDTKQFQQLEQLLVEFANRATAQAKENLSTNRAMAAEFLAKRKAYAAQLETLREKQLNPLQRAPTFTVERRTEQVEFQLPTVPEDQLHVSIRSVNGLNAMAGKDFFVKFSLNFPSASPHEGKTGLARISSREPYSSTQIPAPNVFRFQVSRGRGTQRLFEIKKAVFEVWRPGTMLRNPELVARAYQELTPFLSNCQVNCRIPFVGPNRKPSGGDIEISIQLRYPLRDKEMRSFATEELVVGEYPTPSISPAVQAMAVPSVDILASHPSTASAPPATQQTTETTSAPTSIDEDFDPHHPDLIVSYDVMNEELEKIEAKLPALAGATAEEWTDRFDSLSLKKQLLEIEMQTGKLTIEMYTERLRKRIGEDKQLMAQLLRANRRIDAARVLRRVKIMEKELDSAEPEE